MDKGDGGPKDRGQNTGQDGAAEGRALRVGGPDDREAQEVRLRPGRPAAPFTLPPSSTSTDDTCVETYIIMPMEDIGIIHIDMDRWEMRAERPQETRNDWWGTVRKTVLFPWFYNSVQFKIIIFKNSRCE